MESRRLTVELALPRGRVRIGMDVPTGTVPMSALLPALRTTADALVDYAIQVSVGEGKAVSCRKGCGACCRQVVPVTHSEARRLAELLEGLPEPRRSAVRARFEEAVRRLDDAGLLPSLDGRVPWGAHRASEIGLEYFRLGIPCPFLEDESCSIHPERPLACREYLVTSDAKHCADPSRETIESVPLPTRVWAAVSREELGTPGSEPARCVPLVLAPRWAAAQTSPEPVRPGPELLRGVYARFAHGGGGEGAGGAG